MIQLVCDGAVFLPLLLVIVVQLVCCGGIVVCVDGEHAYLVEIQLVVLASVDVSVGVVLT